MDIQNPCDQESGDPANDVFKLVQLAREGDRDAYDRLARHYRAVVYRTAFLRVGNHEEAEDLAQDILTQAWIKLPTLQRPEAFVSWLKSIAENHCRSWFRKRRPCPSLDYEVEESFAVDRTPLPIDAMLQREAHRKLRAALLELPELNRTALILHVWGDYSYQEIADHTGVRLSAVEGRIHRARRQLRRLVREGGTEFAGESARIAVGNELRNPDRMSGQSTTRSVQRMKKSSKEACTALEQLAALVVFTRRFTTFLDVGVSLVRCFTLLEDVPSPYGHASTRIREELQGGATLSRCMAAQPTLFSGFYVTMVRAGEIGGNLDETLHRTAELLTRELKLACSSEVFKDEIFPMYHADAAPTKWASLSSNQKSVVQIEFCTALGWLSAAGMPEIQALEMAAELLPKGTREALVEACRKLKPGDSVMPALEDAAILEAFIIELIRVGRRRGALDTQLERAVVALEHELECRALVASRTA